MGKDQVVRTEEVGGIEIWFVGDVSDAGRRDAVRMAQVASALRPRVRGYRMYVAGAWNLSGCEWAQAEITRRRNHEVLVIVDRHMPPARAACTTLRRVAMRAR